MFFKRPVLYAIQSVLYMVSTDPEKIYSAAEISEKLQSPKEFTSKIMQSLSREGVVLSKKGRGGGFYLPENYQSIKLIDIIIAIDNKIDFNTCLFGLKNCGSSDSCPVHQSFDNLKTEFKKILFKENLNNLKNHNWFN